MLLQKDRLKLPMIILKQFHLKEVQPFFQIFFPNKNEYNCLSKSNTSLPNKR
jgi:hypothetical protein